MWQSQWGFDTTKSMWQSQWGFDTTKSMWWSQWGFDTTKNMWKSQWCCVDRKHKLGRHSIKHCRIIKMQKRKRNSGGRFDQKVKLKMTKKTTGKSESFPQRWGSRCGNYWVNYLILKPLFTSFTTLLLFYLIILYFSFEKEYNKE